MKSKNVWLMNGYFVQNCYFIILFIRNDEHTVGFVSVSGVYSILLYIIMTNHTNNTSIEKINCFG